MVNKRKLTRLGLAVLPFLTAAGLLLVIILSSSLKFITVSSSKGQANETVRLALGFLASCANPGSVNGTCTSRSGLTANYDLSVIPENLRPIFEPPSVSPAQPLMAAFAFGLLFQLLSGIFIYRGATRFSTGFWVTLLPGLLGPGICLVTFLVLAGWDSKTVKDFNAVNPKQADGETLVAELTNLFATAWAASVVWSLSTVSLIFWKASKSEEPAPKEGGDYPQFE